MKKEKLAYDVTYELISKWWILGIYDRRHAKLHIAFIQLVSHQHKAHTFKGSVRGPRGADCKSTSEFILKQEQDSLACCSPSEEQPSHNSLSKVDFCLPTKRCWTSWASTLLLKRIHKPSREACAEEQHPRTCSIWETDVRRAIKILLSSENT